MVEDVLAVAGAELELSEQPDELRVQAVDTAGNSGWLTEQFGSDNTPPDPPAVSVEGGEEWRAANGFRVSWGNPASAACVSGGCIGVLMTPGATALTRMPRSAYSIASDRVTASSPPLVSDASADGTPFTG